MSQWADAYRMLSSESSAEPGRWRTDWFPPLREIMDCISDPKVERVTFQKPAQVGWTELIGNTVGYVVDLDPSPMLVVQPSLDDAKDWSKERFDPMLRDTPRLQGKIAYGARREKDTSILRKRFPGGFIAIVGANSARGLRSRPIRWLIGDELDAYLPSARGSTKGGTGEGDPWSLAMKRTTRFWNRKIIEGSTPTVRGHSAIERHRLQGSDAECFLPCPHCGFVQTLKWPNLRWESGQPGTAAYICGIITKDGEITEGCGVSIERHHMPAMLRAHRWVHKHPERTKWRTFLINALYALSWADLAEEWLTAQGNREEQKVFTNTRLAETWNDEGEHLSESALEARRETYAAEVPMKAGVLTMGVDVQGDRLEVKVKGWGAGERSWLIHYEQLWGDPAQAEVWRQLDLILLRDWQHESGAMLKIRSTAIDSGGHHTEDVYRYARRMRRHGVWAIKGVGEPGRAAVRPPAKRSKDRLWTLGTNALKDIVYARLEQETAGPGFMHFPMTATNEYFLQLTGEKRVTVYVQGKPVRKYVPIAGRRQEALDCEQYALAALYMLGPVRDRLHLEVARLEAQAKPAEPAPSPAEKPSILPQLRNRGKPMGRQSWANKW